MDNVNTGDNAWVMVSSCLVMFMTPGVGFFYGGMVNKKNLLSTIAYCMLVFCVASLTWALVGFSLAFGDPTAANGFIGDCKFCGLRNITNYPGIVSPYFKTVPQTTFFFFQTMFAGITPAIFIGSIVGRIRLSFLILLTIAFVLIVYSPIAYWVWNTNGWLLKMGALDFAGGNVIHIPAGFAGLASAIYLGLGDTRKISKQNSASISLTLIGTAILWVGWFGFNGGSAGKADNIAATAIANSHISACAGGLAWAVAQYIFTDKPSIIGWCCGSICGLVGITPAAGYVALWAAIPIGVLAAVFSYLFCHFKTKYFEELSDTLDVFGCHGVSALWGGFATGLFATTESGNTYQGGFYGQGHGRQVGVNLLGIVVCAAYAFIMTFILYFLLSRFIEPKVSEEVEHEGLDYAIHGEENDPLTEKEVINILRSVNNFNSIGNIILSNANIESTKQINTDPKKLNPNRQGVEINLNTQTKQESQTQMYKPLKEIS